MKRRFVVRPQVELDIIKHSVYLIEHSARGAAFVDAVEAAFNELAEHPRAGAALDVGRSADLELRFVRPPSFKKYLG